MVPRSESLSKVEGPHEDVTRVGNNWGGKERLYKKSHQKRPQNGLRRVRTHTRMEKSPTGITGTNRFQEKNQGATKGQVHNNNSLGEKKTQNISNNWDKRGGKLRGGGLKKEERI